MSDLTDNYLYSSAERLVAYTFEQNWEVSLQLTYRRCRFWQKKNHLFRWSLFWSWRVCKQAKLLNLGHRNPARIHCKADAPKTIHWLVRMSRGIIGLVFFENERGDAITVNGDRYRAMLNEFYSQKLKRRVLATFGFNRKALRTTQPKLHSMFCTLCLKITLSAAELMSFGHLGAAIWHRWTIICGMPTSQTQLTL